MNSDEFYTTGEFAKKAGVTIRTIRYYDSKGILKPSYTNNLGYRYYSDEDFIKLKKILALKYLGLSLDEIISTENCDYKKEDMMNSLKLQKSIIKNKMNNMKVVLNAIETAEFSMNENSNMKWEEAIDVIKSLESEKELLQRSRDASNLNEGVKLMDRFSTNRYGWYPWVFDNMKIKKKDKVLEIGCGNGVLWAKNMDNLHESIEVTLTEICEDMINEAKLNLRDNSKRFNFIITDLTSLPFDDNSFDVVIANHILFFMKDIDLALAEIKRVIKPNGVVYCSTIGSNHLKELQELMLSFSSNIRIYEDKLSCKFGLENGEKILSKYFNTVEKVLYDDKLIVNDTNNILEYIYSIPGNILDIIDSKKKEFEGYIKKIIDKNGEIFITNSLGLFKAKNK
ncbi:MAG: methyltransferase domain-containing protein [Clostridium sulfidigenes]|uniref:Methyltransferase domain-containing protein n=1 Tax=Clostridium sulfidigenes TaxID=318464 RepID=A0A927W7N1_9CLOT|nr:methyltransferase domain-containing protein [Clostridium sulfidigenes]